MQDVWILSIIRDEQEWDLRCVQASACVLVPHWMTPPLSFCFQFLLLKEPQTFQLWVFFSFFSPPECTFIPSWRQQRGFPGVFYKRQSGGTEGTSLFPSARKLSSELRQSIAWWES